MTSTVLVVGLGQVGRALADACHAAGHLVTGADTDAAALDRARPDAGYDLVSTIPPRNFDVVLLAVQTGLGADGLPDLAPLARATADVAPHLHPGSLVVNECTVYPGATVEVVLAELLAGGAERFHLAYSPERIDPGSSTWGLSNTPKLVAGHTEDALAAAASFYRTFVDTVHPVTGIIEAEFAKLAENSFRALNIAFANELAATADALGVDIAAALDAAATKPFGYLDFRPGPGVGGHCIPIDPHYLDWRARSTGGVEMPLLESALDLNAAAPARVVRQALGTLAGTTRPRVLLIGIAHKRDVDDVRGAPSFEIARSLLEAGVEVLGVDGVVSVFPPGVEALSPEQARGERFDLAIYLTGHGSLSMEDLLVEGTPVIDTRRSLREYAHVVG